MNPTNDQTSVPLRVTQLLVLMDGAVTRLTEDNWHSEAAIMAAGAEMIRHLRDLLPDHARQAGKVSARQPSRLEELSFLRHRMMHLKDEIYQAERALSYQPNDHIVSKHLDALRRMEEHARQKMKELDEASTETPDDRAGGDGGGR